jgi:hypothetical protein
MTVAADLIDAPVDFQRVIVRIAKFHRDLTARPTAAVEVDFRLRRSQTIAGAKDLGKRRYFERKMMKLAIGVLAVASADESEAMMIGVAAQKYHAAGHHVFGIDVGYSEAEDMGVKFYGPFEVGNLEHDMADFGDMEFHALRWRHAF